MLMPASAAHIRMSLFIFIGFVLVWFCVVVSTLNYYHLVPFFPPVAVAALPGEGDEVVVGVVA